MIVSRLMLLFTCGGAGLGCMGDLGGDASGLPPEDTSLLRSALGITECSGTGVPNDVVTLASINVTSPRTYDNPRCDKAYVAELDTISVQFTKTGGIRNAGITVTYADSDLTTWQACINTWLDLVVYRWTGSTWATVWAGASSGGGRWIPLGSGGYCNADSLFVDGPRYLNYHQSYRIAATAQKTFSGPTRKVRIETTYAVDPPR
jgi:hypothetical protein